MLAIGIAMVAYMAFAVRDENSQRRQTARGSGVLEASKVSKPATKTSPAAPTPAPETPEPVQTSSSAAAMRQALEASFAAHYPEIELSDEQLAELSKALLQLKAWRAALRAISSQPGHGAEVQRLTQKVAEATTDFERISGVRLTDFTSKATPGALSHGRDEAPVFETMPEAP